MTRIVKMTNDQFSKLYRDRKTTDLIGKIIGDALVKAAEVTAEREESFWDCVHTASGASDKEEVALDWVNKEFKISEKKGTH